MSAPEDLRGGAPPSPTARRLYFAALAVWLLAWALPSFDSGSRNDGGYGWQCYWTIMGLSPRLALHGEATAFFQALSAWTNFLVPVSVLTLARRRGGWLRRSLPALFVAAWAVNLVWLKEVAPGTRLLIGYYLWLVSFLVLAGATLAVLWKQDPAASSLLGPHRSSGAASKWLTVGAVVALLLLLVPTALGMADLITD